VKRPIRRGRGGFTLLEALISLGLFAVLAVNLSLLTRATERGAGQQDELLELDVIATQTLDRIVLALMSAQAEAIEPLNEAPLNDRRITYVISRGADENGDVVWSDPESVGLEDAGDEVVWQRNQGAENELRVVWGRHVARTALGEELGNLTDDNGDGLIDEFGLSFHLDENGRSVVVQLTLERTSEAGNVLRTACQQRVAFRN
jgi:type II secretory pathway pseudopilin PulG